MTWDCDKIFRFWWWAPLLLIGLTAPLSGRAADRFQDAVGAYETGNFTAAAAGFAPLASQSPAVGVLQNLGLAEWQRGNVAEALIAWERALWLSPRDAQVRNNLQFARETAQLESPDLTWGEIASKWLPASWWAWIASASLWGAVSLAVLPPVLRWRKSWWPQAAMALGLGIFLLTLPANYGVLTRREIGLVLKPETPLSLTPTTEGEPVTRLAAGEPGRVLRTRGDYLLVQTRLTRGWIKRDAFGFISPR